jgi:hypothetical protein
MSHDAHASNDAGGEDGVNIKMIVAVGVIALAAFALCAVVAWWILRNDTNRLKAEGIAPRAPLIGQPEIGIVEQIHFDSDFRLEEWQAAKKKRLGSYGWVDKAKGIVHVPIDKAIDEVVSQHAQQTP